MLRSLRIASSRSFRAALPVRSALPSLRRHDSSQVDRTLASIPNFREEVERKRKAFEAKYGDKLKKKVEEEGVGSLEELKLKKKPVPLVKKAPIKISSDMASANSSSAAKQSPTLPSSKSAKTKTTSSSPIMPLSSILNLTPLLETPHPPTTLATLWQTLHLAKSISTPNRYVSATIPTPVYKKILATAHAHPQFILPLPRSNGGQEFFFLQWQHFPGGESTIVFTSLEEYKIKGEWARVFLTVTHWSDLSRMGEGSPEAEAEGVVLMRGEITSTSPPIKTDINTAQGEKYLLTLEEAQLLLLGLQRFYNVDSGEASTREDRKRVLEGFSKGTWEEKEWTGLAELAVGGLSGAL
ncbi:Mitochondrial F1-ATPase assembly protein [Phaffia rhodozyma]|uniref:Mitochondrial F1-ATPase assembly protein n=1 Tax=Phaffia rhodozyma TaxID=264483 RepID=A0A0F7SWS4_PHARH|nr:Mitochondrial F1-ATPase assembly protein [Phaffia rhodozyma]